MKYVIYYRVSTDKQGRSGLGLEAQQQQVKTYLQSKPDAEIVSEYVEVDSGKKVNRRLGSNIQHGSGTSSQLAFIRNA